MQEGLIYFVDPGSSHRRWLRVLGAYFTARGWAVQYSPGRRLTGLRRADHAYIWNGRTRKAREAAAACRAEGIPYDYAEVGFFPQSSTIMLSQRGSVGGHLLAGEQLQPMGDAEVEELHKFRESYFGEPAPSHTGHVAGILQLQADYAITGEINFNSIQKFIKWAEAEYPGIIFRRHPLCKRQWRTARPMCTAGTLWDFIAKAQLVVGINSTALYEAVLAGKPTRVVGDCALQWYPSARHRVVYEVVKRQIHFTDTHDTITAKILRSTGRLPCNKKQLRSFD